MFRRGPTAALAQNAARLSRQQLDSLTAPIALYPDALLAQVLMAATFPQDGKLYQKNLGPDGAGVAAATKTFDPDPSWQPTSP